MTTNKLLTLSEMKTLARDATNEALRRYPRLENRENLTLGFDATDKEGIFELYFAGERPQDARFISRATVDRVTGEVKVEVFLESCRET